MVHQGVYFRLVPWIFKKGVVVWITKPDYRPAGKYTFGLLQTSVAPVALYNDTFKSFRSTSGTSGGTIHPASSHWHTPRRSDLCFSPLSTLTDTFQELLGQIRNTFQLQGGMTSYNTSNFLFGILQILLGSCGPAL